MQYYQSQEQSQKGPRLHNLSTEQKYIPAKVAFFLFAYIVYLLIIADNSMQNPNDAVYERPLPLPRCQEHGAMGTGSNYVPMDVITLSLVEDCAAR